MTNDGNTMERLRADLLRRAQAEREADLEQSIFRDLEAQNQPQVAEEPRRSGFGAFTGRLFGRRNQPEPASSPSIPLEQTDDHVRDVPEVRLEDGDELGTPKSPIPNTRRASNMRFTLPRISRIWTSGANGPGSPAGSEWPAPMNAREAQYDEQQHYQNHPALDDTLQPPEPVSHARSTFRPPSSRYTDIFMMGSREARSARNRDERQRKRRHKKRRPHHVHNEHRRQGSDGRRRLKKTNRKFLFCFPWVQSRAMRSNILRCFVSGLFLVILLSVCKCDQTRRLIVYPMAGVANANQDRSGAVGNGQRRDERLHHCPYSRRHSGHAVLCIWSRAAVYARGARRSETEREDAPGTRYDYGPVCSAERTYPGDIGERRGSCRHGRPSDQVDAASLWHLEGECGMCWSPITNDNDVLTSLE